MVLSIVALIYTPTNRVPGFPCLPSSVARVCDNGQRHPDRCKLTSPAGFDLHFPDDMPCGALFHIPTVIRVSSFKKYLSGPLLILKSVCLLVFFFIELCFLNILGIS